MDKNTNLKQNPIDFNKYDFLCIGSGVYANLPANELLQNLFKLTHGGLANLELDPTIIYKIFPGPKSGIVFVTYSGIHLGPKEAEPALSLLELEMEHLQNFKCIGRFCCPGGRIPDKKTNKPVLMTYHGDITHRPDEKDLFKTEIFLEEKLEEIDVRSLK